MNSAAAAETFDPLRPGRVRGLGAGAVLSALVHLGLIVALTLAVNWHTSTPKAVVAELWSSTPQEAAPPEQEPPSPPEPAKPQPEPPKPTPQVNERAQREADIALKKARLEKEKKEREEREKEKEKEKRLAEEQREEKRKKEREREKEKEKEKEREKEKARAERLAREQEKDAERRRQENLNRIRGMAGASGGPEASGTAAQSAGPSAGYAGRIKARIKPNIIYADAGPGNPVAEVEVRLSPTGQIMGTRLIKRSGTSEWDDAVLRAVEKTEVLPRDIDGRVPPVIVIEFSRRE